MSRCDKCGGCAPLGNPDDTPDWSEDEEEEMWYDDYEEEEEDRG